MFRLARPLLIDDAPAGQRTRLIAGRADDTTRGADAILATRIKQAPSMGGHTMPVNRPATHDGRQGTRWASKKPRARSAAFRTTRSQSIASRRASRFLKHGQPIICCWPAPAQAAIYYYFASTLEVSRHIIYFYSLDFMTVTAPPKMPAASPLQACRVK